MLRTWQERYPKSEHGVGSYPPGSTEAKKEGCTCLDEWTNNGRGCPGLRDDGIPVYGVSTDCPIHVSMANV